MSSLAPIKNWKPRHDTIVMMHMMGKKNVEIAAALDLTPVRINQILKDPQAVAIIQEGRSKLQEHFIDNVAERMISLGPKAMTNIAETIGAEIPVGSAMKKHQDSVSFQLLGILGFTDQKGGSVGDNSLAMDRDLAERLVGAMEKSAGVSREIFSEVEEAEWQLASESKEQETLPGLLPEMPTSEPTASEFSLEALEVLGDLNEPMNDNPDMVPDDIAL